MVERTDAKVAAVWVDGERVCFAINRGSTDGVRTGHLYGLKLRDVTDPETGEVLGRIAENTAWVAEAKKSMAVCLLERVSPRNFDAEMAGLVVGAVVHPIRSGDIIQTADGAAFAR